MPLLTDFVQLKLSLIKPQLVVELSLGFKAIFTIYWKAFRVDTKSCWVYKVSTATAQNWIVHTRIEAVGREGR